MPRKPKNVSIYDFVGKGLDMGEKKWGKKRFEEYCKNYPHLHKMSDLAFLEELIFQEALHNRIKTDISEKTKAQKDAEQPVRIDKKCQDALKESIDLQLKLKEKLGLFEDKKKLDAFKDFEELKEDFAEYRRKNPNLFKITCPNCSYIYFLKRRTDQYVEVESPFFRDKVLCNPEIFKVYKEGKITKEDYAKIIGTSEDYIDWMAEKIFKTKKVGKK